MKKIFTFAAALMASLTMMAQTITLSEVTPESKWYNVEGVGRVTNKSGNAFSDPDMTCEGSTGFKTGSSYFTIQTYNEISSVVVWARSTSNRTIKALTVSEDLKGSAQSESNVEFTLVGGSEDYAIVKNECANKFTLNFKDAVAANSYIQILFNGNADIVAVTLGNAAPSEDPVTSVTVEGPANGFVGIPVTFKAETDKAANAYKWYVDGAEQEGETAKTFVLTPSAERTYKVWAAAKNDYNADYVAAASVDFVVGGKLCGELIKAVHTGKTTADVSGVVGGTADKSTQGDGKFGGKGQYFGLTLASGAFQTGDKLNVNLSKAAEQGSLAVYADKEGKELLFDTESFGVEGDNEFNLPSAVNGKSTIYICRTEANTWNGYVNFISVNRACGASSDNNIYWLKVNDEEATLKEGTNIYEYTLSASYSEPNVTIDFEIHPLATIKYDLKVPYELSTPDAGGSKGQAFTIIAEDGSEKTYTVQIYKSASLSDDWHLKELSIKGYELDPAFDPEIQEYTITIPYSAEFPSSEDITAVPRHSGAYVDHITTNPENFLVYVIAEDGESANGYIINVKRADAKKDLLRVKFSNGVYGFVNYGGEAGKIGVPFMVGEDDPTFVEAEFWEPDGEPKAEMKDGKLVVTGADGKEASYNIQLFGVPVMEKTMEEIEFTTVPDYIASVYGWDADKGVKFSKDKEEATNHRISEGKDRIYLALPPAKGVKLTSGSGAKRPIVYMVNGIFSDVINTAAKDESITIPLDDTKNNFLGIESKGSNGDGGFIKLQLTDEAQGMENVQRDDVQCTKVLQNGQLFIIREGVMYNAQGAVVK